ncbi:hypothetical protein acdb102_20440 [Acidothermaceae bacterium B102]|nr:hypothetical protein acdb102_20440 [Acidothermaceae bacterium B102]
MLTGSVPPAAASSSFLGTLKTITTVSSTVPKNGDVNPYGVAVVPRSIGRLQRNSVLVSNFNAASNLQGTGTTIEQIAPSGAKSLFATVDARHLPGRCPGGVGLTTALSVLRSGWVVVGSLPTADGTAATAKAGCLLVIDATGTVRSTITNPWINGPWDMTAADHGNKADLYVTNALNGTVAAHGAVVNKGTVVRIRLDLPSGAGVPFAERPVVIGSGFAERSDPAALVVGPTGVTLSSGTLYVADTASNRIAAIPDATTRTTTAFTGLDVSANGLLNSPLGLATAPNGDVLSVNGGDGLIVETSRLGAQRSSKVLDSSGSPAGAGALFGLAVRPDGRAVYFVDDATNTLALLH